MEGRSDLYRFEADHDLNDDWKAHFGYSWNRETYDASQVRVSAVNANGTAGLDKKNRAPLPLWCEAKRRTGSLLMPQYREPLAARTR
jgi:hypothetical protein